MLIHLLPHVSARFLITTLILVRSSSFADDKNYATCGEVHQCANFPNIKYPFWGGSRPEYCGHPDFELNCGTGNAPRITMQSDSYLVLKIHYPTRTLTLVGAEYSNDTCPTTLQNTTLDGTAFDYAADAVSLTLFYGCYINLVGIEFSFSNQFNCSGGAGESAGYFLTSAVAATFGISLGTCKTAVVVKVSQAAAGVLASNPTVWGLKLAIDGGFPAEWTANDGLCDQCVRSGGRCGSDPDNVSAFACYCADGRYPRVCGSGSDSSPSSQGSVRTALYVSGGILAGIGLVCVIFFYRQRRRRLDAEPQHAQAALSIQGKSKDLPSLPRSKGLGTISTSNFSQSIPSYTYSKTESGRASTYFGVQVFTYGELEEATQKFDPSRVLGDGGFGTVYYGKLQDGRAVAVKLLYKNNFKRIEQFMNEIEILARLRHENLVTLYGSTSKRSQELLLVYEYIPNGTVADHLHGKRVNSGLLSWPVRLSIAIETADALAYLHSSDIIHRDVKTKNILLDNDFHVKVADFGLSRLFPNDVTHVSTAPQGTPGYVDPEYYQCYQLTEKSDVYSFGVVLIELVSSKQAVDTNRDQHDINLSNMAINKIQNDALHELVDPSLGFETNNSVRRMTTLVAQLAFRCLQHERDMRPSMGEVLEALRGIKNKEVNAEKAEVLDIVIDDDAPGS